MRRLAAMTILFLMLGSGAWAMEGRAFPTHLIKASASSFLDASKVSGYKPGNVLDGRSNTAWSEGAPGWGLGQWIHLEFTDWVEMTGISIINGYAKAGVYAKNGRVMDATLIFSDGSSQTMRLSDTSQEQWVTLSRPVRTDSVRLVIDSVYPGTKWQDTCISEIRVFGYY